MIKGMGKAPQMAAKEVQTISAAEQVPTGKPKGLMSRGEV
jgi:hypothetical protein